MSARESVSRGICLGCLGGLAMAIAMLVIGGTIYIILKLMGLSPNMILCFSLASGPVIGNGLLLAYSYSRSRRALRNSSINAKYDKSQS